MIPGHSLHFIPSLLIKSLVIPLPPSISAHDHRELIRLLNPCHYCNDRSTRDSYQPTSTNIKQHGGFLKWGHPTMDGLFHEKSRQMDDNYTRAVIGGSPMTQRKPRCEAVLASAGYRLRSQRPLLLGLPRCRSRGVVLHPAGALAESDGNIPWCNTG